MRTIDSSSKKDGFRMPGEFEKHAGCYIIWPERPDNWRLEPNLRKKLLLMWRQRFPVLNQLQLLQVQVNM